MRTVIVTVAAFLCTATAAWAADPSSKYVSGMSTERLERVTEVLDKYIAANDTGGSVSLVYRHGKTVYVAARGYQDRETKTPMTRGTIFALASMTKPVVAAAMMILVEEGKIRLDDPIDKFLPELANPQVLDRVDGPLSETHPSPCPITLRDIMTYRMGTGAPGMSSIPPAAPISKAYAGLEGTAGGTADDYMKRLGALPLVFDPGDQFMYQTPSIVMGVLIQRITGQPFDKFMEERIFKPLGMKDTGFWVPATKRARLATVYIAGTMPGTLIPNTGHWSQLEPPIFPSGASGLYSTTDDYLKFARMMLQGGEVDGTRILSRKSVELMTRDHITQAQRDSARTWVNRWRDAGWGFGLEIIVKQPSIGPSPGSFHWDGSTAVRWIADPKEDLIYVRMLNRVGLSLGSSGTIDPDMDAAVYQAIVD